MEKLARLARLQALIQVTGDRIGGRDKLHKTVYLYQKAAIDFGQSFTFQFTGVYSSSLEYDLMLAEDWHILRRDGDDEVGGFIVELGSDPFPETELSAHVAALRSSPVDALVSKQASMLDGISTIIYLAECGYSGDVLEGLLRKLRPHLDEQIPVAFALTQQFFGSYQAVNRRKAQGILAS